MRLKRHSILVESASIEEKPVEMVQNSLKPESTIKTSPGDYCTLETRTIIKSAVLFLATFVIYFVSRSPGLDDFDSVNFALGLRQFNLWEHQPHPPGYPLFIFSGWLLQKLLHIGPQAALEIVSVFGGALLVASWFLIIQLQFGERPAWWVAICLAVTPVVWMTATKVLSDAFASGLLSFEIFAAIYFLKRRSGGALLSASLLGAAVTGVRPQLILVAVVVLVTALKQAKAGLKTWMSGLCIFFIGCLTWLLPTCYLQAQLRPDLPAWLVYPQLLFGQWKWRLNNPYAFIGAGNWSPRYLAVRFADHILGWFGLGFGLIQSWPAFVVGVVIFLGGLVAYFSHRRSSEDTAFWRFHAPWALLHILIIFAFLGGKQRYYLVIFPLLLAVILRGWLNLRKPWSSATFLLPLLLLSITIPTAVQSHREQPPPVRLVRYLSQLYPIKKRKDVALLFTHAQRHAEWYAPEFRVFTVVPSPQNLANDLGNAIAVYTDDDKLPLPSGWRRVPMAIFQRSVIIHSKYHSVMLYLILRES